MEIAATKAPADRRADAHDGRRVDGRRKRVALFTGAYNHIADGVSLTLNRLVDYLQRHGTKVRVFAPSVDDAPVDHNGTLVPVPSVPAPGRPEYRISLGISPEVRRQIEAFRPTLIHIATPDLLGYQALQFAQDRGLPVVSSYHTHFSSYLKYYHLDMLEGVLWKYLQWFYGQCRHVYVPSPSIADDLRRHGITDGLRLWRRGVDTSHFTPDRRSAAWRREHGVTDDEVIISFVSRLVWEKGLDVYADVIERLERRGIPHRSMIVGDGPARDELETRLDRTIFTGHLSGSDLARAYASSDIFLFPSDTETFGNVTLEAMASGVPTVCANATGSNALVDDGSTGFLAPPGDTDAFFNAVEHLVTHSELRARMGHAAREAALRYEWETVLGHMNQYYDEILRPAVFSGDGASVPEPAL
jgi:glycosyltransferase involved in cell wall biosynthesis